MHLPVQCYQCSRAQEIKCDRSIFSEGQTLTTHCRWPACRNQLALWFMADITTSVSYSVWGKIFRGALLDLRIGHVDSVMWEREKWGLSAASSIMLSWMLLTEPDSQRCPGALKTDKLFWCPSSSWRSYFVCLCCHFFVLSSKYCWQMLQARH